MNVKLEDNIPVIRATLTAPGKKGEKGDTPKITSMRVGRTTILNADGVEFARIEDGANFEFSDFTPEQLALLKGEKGEKGDKGNKGDKGDSLDFDSLTEEQLNEIRGLDDSSTSDDKVWSSSKIQSVIDGIIRELISSMTTEDNELLMTEDSDYIVL